MESIFKEFNEYERNLAKLRDLKVFHFTIFTLKKVIYLVTNVLFKLKLSKRERDLSRKLNQKHNFNLEREYNEVKLELSKAEFDGKIHTFIIKSYIIIKSLLF